MIGKIDPHLPVNGSDVRYSTLRHVLLQVITKLNEIIEVVDHQEAQDGQDSTHPPATASEG